MYVFMVSFKTRPDLDISLGDVVSVYVAAKDDVEARTKARAAMARDYELHLSQLADHDYAEVLSGMVFDGSGMSEEEAKTFVEENAPNPEKLREQMVALLADARMISLEEMGKIVL